MASHEVFSFGKYTPRRIGMSPLPQLPSSSLPLDNSFSFLDIVNRDNSGRGPQAGGFSPWTSLFSH